jgi:hypothetical protein
MSRLPWLYRGSRGRTILGAARYWTVKEHAITDETTEILLEYSRRDYQGENEHPSAQSQRPARPNDRAAGRQVKGTPAPGERKKAIPSSVFHVKSRRTCEQPH